MEKVAFKQIRDYFTNIKLFSCSQHAYRQGHSTSIALAQLTDDWLSQIDSKNMVGTVMMDLSAAFDVVDHDIMISKLRTNGFNTMALAWMLSYLSGRSQRVCFNGSLSERKYNHCGVPQGSCLGPLVFIILTNDLPCATTDTNMVTYADDTTLYSTAPTLNDLVNTLNQNLERVSYWVKDSKLVMNADQAHAS